MNMDDLPIHSDLNNLLVLRKPSWLTFNDIDRPYRPDRDWKNRKSKLRGPNLDDSTASISYNGTAWRNIIHHQLKQFRNIQKTL